MNIREARKLKPGAIVREAWGPEFRQAIVLSKTHVVEEHVAKTLCQKKQERYDVVVHWLGRGAPAQYLEGGVQNRAALQTRQNWELMVVSHAS